ncbi:MAG: serine hydrolase, partial [Candidatus Dormiibacterota bacterium]
ATPALTPSPSASPTPPPLPVPAASAPLFGTTWLTRHPQPALKLPGHAAILVDVATRQVMYESKQNQELPTASLAKLVTVLVALQHATLTTELTVPAAATHLESDATEMGLTAGEQLSVGELLDGVFLLSANDAAETLAQAIMPRPDFIRDMNLLVRSWGLRDTLFSNPTGLDDPDEYSTAYDLAVTAWHVESDQPSLEQITSQKEIQLPQTATHKAYDLHTVVGPVLHDFPGATGLKTGYTDDAGYCLAATATRGPRSLIAIVLGSPTDIADAEALLSYGFSVTPTG